MKISGAEVGIPADAAAFRAQLQARLAEHAAAADAGYPDNPDLVIDEQGTATLNGTGPPRHIAGITAHELGATARRHTTIPKLNGAIADVERVGRSVTSWRRRVGPWTPGLAMGASIMRTPEVSATLADGAWLTRRYVTDLASTRDIAGELGCSTYAVTQALIRHGIPRRPVGWHKGDETQELQDRDFLLGRYVNDQMSIQQIADLVGCGVGRVRKALREHEIPVRWVGRRNPLPVDGAWLTRRYVTDLASIRDIAGELDLPQSAVLQALIRHGIPRRPLGTPKGLPSREEQVACLRQVAVQELQRILVEADTESGAATALGVSQIVLTEVVADAGIDREQVARERRARKRIAAWPVLLRDRDGLAETLDKWAVPAVARLAGCSLGLVRSAADHHNIQLAEGDRRRRPRWTHQPPAPLAPSATTGPEPLNAANATRTQAAAARAIDAARDMLRDGGCPVQYRVVLQARVDHPQASLAELGAMFGTSKDAYAAVLRRALTSRRPGQPLPAAPPTPHAYATIQRGSAVLAL